MSSSMLTEFEEIKRRPKEKDLIKKVLNRLFLINKGETFQKKEIRMICNLREGESSRVNSESLMSLYHLITNHLNLKYPLLTSRTIEESSFEIFIKSVMNKRLLNTCWIGNHCVDFFFPTIGLIVEINGGIHNHEQKMKKDRLRDDRLMQDCKLIVFEALNEDIRGREFAKYSNLKNLNHIGTLKLRNNWRKIYIETISSFCSINFLSDRFGYDFKKLIRIV